MTEFKDAIGVFYELTECGKMSWDSLGIGAGWQTTSNDRTCVVMPTGGAQVSFFYKGMRRTRSGTNNASTRLSRLLEDRFPIPQRVPDDEFFTEFVKGLKNGEGP